MLTRYLLLQMILSCLPSITPIGALLKKIRSLALSLSLFLNCFDQLICRSARFRDRFQLLVQLFHHKANLSYLLTPFEVCSLHKTPTFKEVEEEDDEEVEVGRN